MGNTRLNIQKEVLIQYYLKEKLNAPEIAKKLGCSVPPIRLRLKIYNIPFRNDRQIYFYNRLTENFDSENIKPEMGYFLGIILTDGHIQPTGVQFAFTEEDVKYFRDTISEIFDIHPQLKITHRRGHHFGKYLCKNSGSFSCNSKELRNFLVKKMEIGPRKTENCHVSQPIFNMSKECVSAFIMGVIDGDGCATNGGRVSISSISKRFLKDIKTLLDKYSNCNSSITLRKKLENKSLSKQQYCLYVSNSKGCLYDFLKLSPYHLPRKFDKIKVYAEKMKLIKENKEKKIGEAIKMREKLHYDYNRIARKLNIDRGTAQIYAPMSNFSEEIKQKAIEMRKKGFGTLKIGEELGITRSMAYKFTKYLKMDSRRIPKEIIQKIIELRKLRKTQKEISKELHVGTYAVWKYTKNLNIVPIGRYPKEVKEKAVELRMMGYSYAKIGKKLGVNSVSAYYWTKQLGVHIVNRYSEDIKQKAVDMRKLRYSYDKISKKLGIGHTTAKRYTKDITIIPLGRYPENIRQEAVKLRESGNGYTKIAKALGISTATARNYVRSMCRFEKM